MKADTKIDNARKAINDSGIMVKLAGYNPVVVSTIFVGLDTATSDIDIVCSYEDSVSFTEHMKHTLGVFADSSTFVCNDHIVTSFYYNDFEFEIYASHEDVKLQNGYRHYQIMKTLVEIGGSKFQKLVTELKNNGFKTEPAICKILGISGDPYKEILQLESWSGDKLETHIPDKI